MISERVQMARRKRRVLTWVSRAAWRLEQAERERTWALVSARAEGISIRTLATAIGLSPSRVHQLVADADLDAVMTSPSLPAPLAVLSHPPTATPSAAHDTPSAGPM